MKINLRTKSTLMLSSIRNKLVPYYLLGFALKQSIVLILLLVLLQYIIPSCFLEPNVSNEDKVIYNNLHAFYMRQFETDYAVLENHINHCDDPDELHRIQGIIENYLDSTVKEVYPPEVFSSVSEIPDRTSSWKKAFLFFVGVSVTVIILWYSKDILEVLFCSMVTMKLNILQSLEELLIKDPESLNKVIIDLNLIDQT